MITSLPLFIHPVLWVLWKAGEMETNKHTGKQNPVQTSKGFLGRRKCVALAMINLVHLSESRLRETISCILEDYPLKWLEDICKWSSLRRSLWLVTSFTKVKQRLKETLHLWWRPHRWLTKGWNHAKFFVQCSRGAQHHTKAKHHLPDWKGKAWRTVRG